MNYMDQYKFWLEDSYFDEGTKEELRKIADNQAEIEDRFYKDLAIRREPSTMSRMSPLLLSQ